MFLNSQFSRREGEKKKKEKIFAHGEFVVDPFFLSFRYVCLIYK